jgi:hypothetical protein
MFCSAWMLPRKQVCTRTKVYVICYLAPGAFQALFLCARVCPCLTSARVDSEMVSLPCSAIPTSGVIEAPWQGRQRGRVCLAESWAGAQHCPRSISGRVVTSYEFVNELAAHPRAFLGMHIEMHCSVLVYAVHQTGTHHYHQVSCTAAVISSRLLFEVVECLHWLKREIGHYRFLSFLDRSTAQNASQCFHTSTNRRQR